MQHLEAEVPLKSLISIAQTVDYWFWFAGWVKIRTRCLALPEICHILLRLSIVSFKDKAENCMWNLKCLLEMRNQDLLNFDNVKMKHFIFYTSGGGRSQDYAGVEKQCWMTLARSPAPAAHFTLRSEEGVCSAQHPGVHQCNDIPRQEGGHAEPTSPILACAQNLPSNKDDSLVTAAAA